MSDLKIKVLSETHYSKPKKWFGVRHFQFLFCFFTLFFAYGQRTALSVTIIAMTDDAQTDSSIPTYPDWKNTDTILSSFFWGYVLTQAIAGQLGERFGPKWLIVGTLIVGSVFNALIPAMAAALGSTGVMLCRIVQGLNQGSVFPCINILMSKWAPSSERSRVFSMIHSGVPLGIVVSMLFSGAISGSTLGWTYVYYFYSGATIVFAVLFGIFVANAPALHKSISEEERIYVESTNNAHNQKVVSTPWKEILTSVHVWAIFVSLCGIAWGSFTLLTEIPSYLSNVMDFNINSSSSLSALPYFVMFLMNFAVSPIADKLIATKLLSLGATRKVFNTIGMVVPGIALFALGFIDGPQQKTAVGLLILAVGSTSFYYPGSMVNAIDLSPNFAGTLMGLTNGTSQIFSILGPLTVDFLGDNKKDLMLWRKVFWIAAGIYVSCGIFFTIFSSGELQKWNNFSKDYAEKKEQKKDDLIEKV